MSSKGISSLRGRGSLGEASRDLVGLVLLLLFVLLVTVDNCPALPLRLLSFSSAQNVRKQITTQKDFIKLFYIVEPH